MFVISGKTNHVARHGPPDCHSDPGNARHATPRITTLANLSFHLGFIIQVARAPMPLKRSDADAKPPADRFRMVQVMPRSFVVYSAARCRPHNPRGGRRPSVVNGARPLDEDGGLLDAEPRPRNCGAFPLSQAAQRGPSLRFPACSLQQNLHGPFRGLPTGPPRRVDPGGHKARPARQILLRIVVVSSFRAWPAYSCLASHHRDGMRPDPASGPIGRPPVRVGPPLVPLL